MEKSGSSFFKGVGSLKELGEFGLIGRLSAAFSSGLPEGVRGIGDDCAVLPFSGTWSLLVTTDMLMEDRHFRRTWISPEDLGYKSLAVSLSDISAMGGEPAYSFLSLSLPKEISIHWLDRFFQGKQELATDNNITIAGGDTTRSTGPMVINHTVLGFAAPEQIKLRSSAKTGDRICLLGRIGESGAGLKLLAERSAAEQKHYSSLIQAHHRPALHLKEARFLGGFEAVHSMIDLSDGLHPDAMHIAESSDKQLLIDVDSLPLSPNLQSACSEFGWSAAEMALTGGEDYSLLFTIGESEADSIQKKFLNRFGRSFATIGRVAGGTPGIRLTQGGETLDLDKTGYDHFKTG